jgi:hypothetical protein
MKHRASGWILHADWSQNEFGNPLVCRNLFSYILPTSLWYSSRMLGRNSLTVVCNLLRVPSISGSFPSKNKTWFLLVECGLGPSSLTEFWVFLRRCKQMLRLRCVEKSGSEKTVNLGTMWKKVALVCFKVLSRRSPGWTERQSPTFLITDGLKNGILSGNLSDTRQVTA